MVVMVKVVLTVGTLAKGGAAYSQLVALAVVLLAPRLLALASSPVHQHLSFFLINHLWFECERVPSKNFISSLDSLFIILFLITAVETPAVFPANSPFGKALAVHLQTLGPLTAALMALFFRVFLFLSLITYHNRIYPTHLFGFFVYLFLVPLLQPILCLEYIF